MAGVRIAFSGSFPENKFLLLISVLFLTLVDDHSYSLSHGYWQEGLCVASWPLRNRSDFKFHLRVHVSRLVV